MAAILKTTFSNVFSWKSITEFYLKFHHSSFVAKGPIENKPILYQIMAWCVYASLGLNDLSWRKVTINWSSESLCLMSHSSAYKNPANKIQILQNSQRKTTQTGILDWQTKTSIMHIQNPNKLFANYYGSLTQRVFLNKLLFISILGHTDEQLKYDQANVQHTHTHTIYISWV